MRRRPLRTIASLIGLTLLLSLAAVAGARPDGSRRADDAKRKHSGPAPAKSYPQMVLASKPVGYWPGRNERQDRVQ